MPFGRLTYVGLRNHVLYGSQDPPEDGAILGAGVVRPIEKHWYHSVLDNDMTARLRLVGVILHCPP